MVVNAEQRATIEAVVALFETGNPAGGDPGTVAVLPDGAGVSYGVHQATDASDALDEVLVEYLTAASGAFVSLETRANADALRPYLARLARDESAADPYAPWVQDLATALRTAGRDPVMLAAQRTVFGRRYWAPVEHLALDLELRHPLSWLALYDTAVQSGPGAIARMRARFPELPPARGGDEEAWTTAYLGARLTWLAGFLGRTDAHTRAVRRTVYRPQAMLELVREGRWALSRPLRVWDRTIA